MTPAVVPLHPLFGAEMALPHPDGADARTVSAIADAVHRYGLVLFRDLRLDDEALLRFAARFGALQAMSARPGVARHVIRVSNLAADGTVEAADATSRLRHAANLLWHTDSSFLSPGASYSFLHARIVARSGGRTEFCDGRVGWEMLSPAERSELAELEADHSMLHSWRLTGVDLAKVAPSPMPTVRRRLAPLHRPSGRRTLLVPSHVARVGGRDAAASAAMLARLTAVAAAPPRTYAHDWRPGDLLVWDNRCMLHRVTPYDGMAEPRDLRSCRVLDPDDESVVVQAAA